MLKYSRQKKTGMFSCRSSIRCLNCPAALPLTFGYKTCAFKSIVLVTRCKRNLVAHTLRTYEKSTCFIATVVGMWAILHSNVIVVRVHEVETVHVNNLNSFSRSFVLCFKIPFADCPTKRKVFRPEKLSTKREIIYV
jgi:hypothetical protein